MKNLNYLLHYVCRYGQRQTTGDDVGDVDDVKPKVMLYDSLSEEKRKASLSVHVVQRKTQMPHLKRVANWRLEKNPGSDQVQTHDRPPRLTHTHTSNTTYTNYIVIVRIITTVRNKLD